MDWDSFLWGVGATFLTIVFLGIVVEPFSTWLRDKRAGL